MIDFSEQAGPMSLAFSNRFTIADLRNEVNSDFDALQKAGSMGGSGGMMVLDDTVCIVQSTFILAEFYHDESCGQCSPCREGTGWMEKILHRIEHGAGRPGPGWSGRT